MSRTSPTKDSRLRVIRLMPVLDYGGVETRTKVLARNLDRSRFELRVCTFWKPGHAARQVEAAGIPVDVLDANPAISNPKASIRLFRYLKKQRPDILHCAIAEANFHGALSGRAANVPVLIGEEVGIPERSAKAKLIFGLIYRLLDRLVGVSDATCRYLIDHEHAAPAKVERIYNSIEASFLSDVERDYEQRGRFSILTVGRLVEEKNHLGLLRLFRQVVDSQPNVVLRIAGEGPLHEQLAEEIVRLELQEHVQLLGFREDVHELLLDSDLFVLPSISEGYGIALVEAMATGMPVIATTAGGVVEVMGELRDNWSIPPHAHQRWTEAILDIFERTSEERRRLGNRARAIAARNFSPEAYTERVSELYERLLTESSR